MKVLNLRSGIGGNRKLWGDVEVTAIENNTDIAIAYENNFPQDNVIVTDARDYLLNHFDEYDFIWNSPVCTTLSRARYWRWAKEKPVYPDFSLYEEITFLEHYYDGLYAVENVIPYHEAMIPPTKVIGRHCVWSNFGIGEYDIHESFHQQENRIIAEQYGLNVNGEIRKKAIRNMVHPEIGLYILNCARGIITKPNPKQSDLFV